MKVETPKNKEVDKSELRRTKSESANLNNPSQLKTFDSPPPTNGAFAKILEEAKKESQNSKTLANENDSTESVKTSDSKKENVNNKSDNKVVERENRNGRENQGGSKNEDENPSASAFYIVQNAGKMNSEFSAPPARSILHVADLERIISTIRTETFKNNHLALLTLKNSVLEGLQIKISLDESGNFKAEFLALNKQIKKQLEIRKRELKDIFRSRSLNLSEIEVLVQP